MPHKPSVYGAALDILIGIIEESKKIKNNNIRYRILAGETIHCDGLPFELSDDTELTSNTDFVEWVSGKQTGPGINLKKWFRQVGACWVSFRDIIKMRKK